MYRTHFIFYVANQRKSREFYEKIFAMWPTRDEPGMTEFVLGDGAVLGLMPAAGIKRLLGDGIADPNSANGIPRAELYMRVWYADLYLTRAEAAGGKILSPVKMRDWGEEVGYASDLDGHILAFAKIKEE